MFLYNLLVALFVILCFLLGLIILVQKGKGSMGIGNLGGGTQMLFGGSGGQDLFQKITWVMGALFMAGSLALALMKSSSLQTSRYLTKKTAAPVHQEAPIAQEVPQEAPENS